MDSNQDGQLSGEELKPLGLWFDYNRDGISQAGEVKPLTETGVIALYFQSFRQDPKTKDLIARLGYRRVLDGKIIDGASFDWYAERFATKFEAMRALNSRGTLTEFIPNAEMNGGVTSGTEFEFDPREITSESRFSEALDLTGTWLWHIDEDQLSSSLNGLTPKGAFVFRNAAKDAFEGRALIETPLRSRSKAKYMITKMPLYGSRSLSPDGTSILVAFSATTSHGGLTKSEAVLSADGTTLSGKSTAVFPESLNSKNTIEVTYRWTAKRY
jgi:hypothetical protein